MLGPLSAFQEGICHQNLETKLPPPCPPPVKAQMLADYVQKVEAVNYLYHNGLVSED